jgi:hypothetical protein
MNLDPEDYAYNSADPSISKTFGIVGREDITANLLEFRSPVSATAGAGPQPRRSLQQTRCRRPDPFPYRRPVQVPARNDRDNGDDH